MKNILIILISLFVITSIQGQNISDPLNVDNDDLSAVQRKMLARQQIQDLKDGVLIVRLKTNDKALKKLESILNNPNTKKKSKQRIRKKTIPQLKAAAKDLNDKMRRAFSESYTFSEVYFMPDTSTDDLQNKRTRTSLTDAQGNAVSSDVLTEKNIFLVDYGQLPNDKTASITGLIISDIDSNTLHPPFPYFQRSGGVFVKLSSNKLTDENAVKMIQIWNKKLKSYLKNQ